MNNNKDNTVDFYMVVTSHDTNDSVFGRTFRHYGLDIKSSRSHFGLNWSTIRVTGKSSSLLEFLSNDFARRRVIWVGLKNPSAFVTKAGKHFSPSEKRHNESWGGGDDSNSDLYYGDEPIDE